MRCKYCHSTDHNIDRCHTIVCRNCKTVGHAVWLCPSSSPVPSPVLANPTSPGLVIDDLPEEVEERKESTLASTYWKKDQMVYNFSTNSLSSPKNAASPRIPSAESLRKTQSTLSVEGNGNDKEKKRRDREKGKKNGWVSSEQGGNQNPSRNSGNNRYGGSGNIRDFRNAVQKPAQPSLEIADLQKVAGSRQPSRFLGEENNDDLRCNSVHLASLDPSGANRVDDSLLLCARSEDRANRVVEGTCPPQIQDSKSSAHLGSSILSRDMRDVSIRQPHRVEDSLLIPQKTSGNFQSTSTLLGQDGRSKKPVLPTPPVLRNDQQDQSLPRRGGGDVKRGSKNSTGSQFSRGHTLESVFGGSPRTDAGLISQNKSSGSHVSTENLPVDHSNENRKEIKLEDVTTRYYQKMIHLNWGDIVM